MESEWDAGYFVGVNPETTEYLVIKEDGVFSCATIRRLQDDQAFDPKILNEVNVTYSQYILKGASSTPVRVRPATFSAPNPDPPANPGAPEGQTQARRFPAT